MREHMVVLASHPPFLIASSVALVFWCGSTVSMLDSDYSAGLVHCNTNLMVQSTMRQVSSYEVWERITSTLGR